MMKWFKKNRDLDLPEFWMVYEHCFDEKLSNDISEVRFVVLDTETTGFDYHLDRILSIGAIDLIDNTILVNTAFDVYLEQKNHKKESAKIHGILPNDNLEFIPEHVAIKKLLEYLKNAVIVGHHIVFDIRMINKALQRNGLPELKNSYLDTAWLYQKTLLRSNLVMKKENYTLDELAEKFDVSKKDRHTALGDAYITAIVFFRVLSKLKEKREVTLKWLLK